MSPLLILALICITTSNSLLIPSPLSNSMRKFVTDIIQQNAHDKNGFFFINLNTQEWEFSDFVIKKISEFSQVIHFDFSRNKSMIDEQLNPNRFIISMVDPFGDIAFGVQTFETVKVSRAKVLIILTKKPLPIFVKYILNAYWKTKSINIIVAFEVDNRIEIFTYNPYRQYNDVHNISNYPIQELFYDKTKNLHGNSIRCLLTYRDRTKVQRKKSQSGETFYEGKDFIAIATLLSDLNAKLELVTMDNVLINPWFESILLPNKNERKLKFLEQRDISILIKSEQFTMDDDIFDNLYPHVQNDLCSLVPKSPEISLAMNLVKIYNPIMWITMTLLSLALVVLLVAVRKFLGHHINSLKIMTEVFRIGILNNVYPAPKRSLEKILVVGWIISSYLVNVFLQTRITSFLTVRKFYPNIDTIEDLVASQLPLYSIPFHKIELEKKYQGTRYEEYAKKVIHLTTNEGFMDQMTYRNDVNQIPAFLLEHDIALFVSRCQDLHHKEAQDYHLVKESIMPNYQAYKVIHNSPLMPILNRKLRRLGEGGFIDLWAKNTIYNATLEGFLYPENYDDVSLTRALSFDVVYVWFFGLICGYVLSSLVFLFEILIVKCGKVVSKSSE